MVDIVIRPTLYGVPRIYSLLLSKSSPDLCLHTPSISGLPTINISNPLNAQAVLRPSCTHDSVTPYEPLNSKEG
jgi:hypothetical protein